MRHSRRLCLTYSGRCLCFIMVLYNPQHNGLGPYLHKLRSTSYGRTWSRCSPNREGPIQANALGSGSSTMYLRRGPGLQVQYTVRNAFFSVTYRHSIWGDGPALELRLRLSYYASLRSLLSRIRALTTCLHFRFSPHLV